MASQQHSKVGSSLRIPGVMSRKDARKMGVWVRRWVRRPPASYCAPPPHSCTALRHLTVAATQEVVRKPPQFPNEAVHALIRSVIIACHCEPNVQLHPQTFSLLPSPVAWPCVCRPAGPVYCPAARLRAATHSPLSLLHFFHYVN